MRNKTLAHQLIADRLPRIAAQLQELAEQQSLKIDITPEIGGETAQLAMSGPNIMSQQFGDRETQASASISRLLQSLAQIGRQSS
ncbi:hypothetical protein [Cohaesibacter celericrescens]|jgi:hypothetical protein|uniref:Uncharacterized protein n=1 Tax=Cohaesibacter celericrescens TaxID=2067669 RepID=A0A2N5XR34_9HYPH|nr:hypothetical protein [Cohaesibacter celericrescens]PLW76959.1 hypothetical protein C0081_13010 [Cohaesibacter celericrescens]